MQSMAITTTRFFSSSLYNSKVHTPPNPPALLSSSHTHRRASYNTLVFHAVQLLGPPAKFEASKLKVVFTEAKTDTSSRIVPRTYILSHCDFTANLTLTISKILYQDQLRGWYSKDDVVAEWTEVKGSLFLDVHCYVSGQNFLSELAAELRYHIFSKELPLVLEAVLYGDSELFDKHPHLMDALVRIFFHSSSKNYNHVEYWGPLWEAKLKSKEGQFHGLLPAGSNDFRNTKLWITPKSIFQALVAFLL